MFFCRLLKEASEGARAATAREVPVEHERPMLLRNSEACMLPSKLEHGLSLVSLVPKTKRFKAIVRV